MHSPQAAHPIIPAQNQRNAIPADVKDRRVRLARAATSV
jgi:hypothetical protein